MQRSFRACCPSIVPPKTRATPVPPKTRATIVSPKLERQLCFSKLQAEPERDQQENFPYMAMQGVATPRFTKRPAVVLVRYSEVRRQTTFLCSGSRSKYFRPSQASKKTILSASSSKTTSNKLRKLFMEWEVKHSVTERESVCLTATTENWEKVLTLMSSCFKLPTINCLIPSSRTLRRLNTNFHCYFSSLMRPKKSYSGFRISMVRAVKAAAFMLWGITDISGMNVDIWGDGVEIGRN